MDTFRDHPNFTFLELDCRDALRVRRTFAGCDALVHLAAEKIPRYGGALKTLQANVAGAESLYEAALALDVPVLVASTSDVYGNATPPFAEDANLTLGPPTTRRWAYATSKLYDEHVALAMAADALVAQAADHQSLIRMRPAQRGREQPDHLAPQRLGRIRRR